MKKILFFILISSYSLFADALPTTIKSSVKSSSNNTIQLTSNVPAGISGIVIHNYGNALTAITHTTISLGNGEATIQPYNNIIHRNIPDIKTEVSVGDTIIFGNFYNNVLLIAPNQTAYRQVTKKFQRAWIHPDIFALDFIKQGASQLNMNILKAFAKKHQVGLVLVVTIDKLLVIDPISKKVIGSTGLRTNPNTATAPFYARFKQLDLSFMNLSEQNYVPYFKSVAGLK